MSTPARCRVAAVCGLALAIGACAPPPAPTEAGPAKPPAPTVAKPAAPATGLRAEGAFGFPQHEATVLCDTPDLRLSVWNDAAHLYAQAVLWTDNDPSVGKAADGRAVGDNAVLRVDADADGKPTPKADRNYSLNPWPHLPGLRYSVVNGPNAMSTLQADSKGRGAVRYEVDGGARVRVDSFLVPLAELGRKPGDKVRLAYWGGSPNPKRTVNSVGFVGKDPYYAHDLPREADHEVVLADRPAALDPAVVPDGRKDPNPSAPPPQTAKRAGGHPPVGSAPPEVAAADWLHIPGTPTLAGLKGKVVVVEFWATWCGPCVAGIPHLNELHEKYGPKGLVILSLTDEKKEVVQAFIQKKPMKYALGCGSQTLRAYGVNGIPQAFLIGRDGTLLWEGHPANPAFDRALVAALGGNEG